MTYELDEPYPLQRKFRIWIIPAFLALVVLIPALAGYSGASLIEAVYLTLAERRAQVIDRAVNDYFAETWLKLRASSDPNMVYASPRGAELLKAIDVEVSELKLSGLKIYGKKGVLLYDDDHRRIGTRDVSSAFVLAMNEGDRSAVYKPQPDGLPLYELYVRLSDASGESPLVFELYEPAKELNKLLFIAAAPVAILVAIMLLFITWGLSRLVGRAQGDINKRTEMLSEVRSKLEGFVSSRAVTAAHESLGSGEITSERVTVTLLYSDIRGFTSYSESVEPEAVVAFLNKIMSLQIDVVKSAGGDIDKMIGDALLVRFDGIDRERRAIAAAVEIQKQISRGGMPRGVGIGVYSGEVISGVIGPAERQDFTVIGDSVNAVARLSSAAKENEIVADIGTVRAAGIENFGAAEVISVKGKQKNLSVQRWPELN